MEESKVQGTNQGDRVLESDQDHDHPSLVTNYTFSQEKGQAVTQTKAKEYVSNLNPKAKIRQSELNSHTWRVYTFQGRKK